MSEGRSINNENKHIVDYIVRLYCEVSVLLLKLFHNYLYYYSFVLFSITIIVDM